MAPVGTTNQPPSLPTPQPRIRPIRRTPLPHHATLNPLLGPPPTLPHPASLLLLWRIATPVMASRAAAAKVSSATRTALGVKKNVHIEEWASFRENCEHVFQVSLKNLGVFAVAGVGVPYCVYRAIIHEQVRCGPLAGAGGGDGPCAQRGGDSAWRGSFPRLVGRAVRRGLPVLHGFASR